MKTLENFLSELVNQDVKLWVEDGRLRCKAPEGVLTSELRTQLTERKQEIITFLQQANLDDDELPLKPIERSGNFPTLSFAQQRLWILEQFGIVSNAYNMPLTLHLRGELQLEALKRSLNQLIVRHETLRTTFKEINDAPVQVIHSSYELELPIVDLSGLTSSPQNTKLLQLLQQENQQQFNIEQDPPIRAKIFKLGKNEHILVVILHHIAADGWSMKVFAEELAACYQALVTDQQLALQELPVQYADFAIWQRNWLQGSAMQTQLDYWKQKLRDIPQLQLPTDYPRPARQTFRGEEQIFNLSAKLTAKLNELSQQQGVTPFITLLAAFQVLLYRYSGQEKIVVGSPIANRTRQEIQGLIGFFVNSLVMYTNLEGEPSFLEVLNRVRQTAIEAYSHQDIPFEKLVEELQPERSLQHNPLFQVMFGFQQAEALVSSFSLPNLEMSLYPMAGVEKTVRMDLELHLWQEEEQLKVWCTYNRDLFKADTIKGMLSHYQTLLEEIVKEPEQPISLLLLLTVKEQQQLLVEWNNTKTDYPRDKCIHELLTAQVEKTPSAVAVEFEGKQLTYSQLDSKANQLAHHLQQLGVKPDVLVGICIQRSLEMVISLLAILKAGGAYVPLDPSYPAERLAYMLGDAKVSILLTQESLVKSLPEHPCKIICVDSDWNQNTDCGTRELSNEVKPSNLGYVIYTSGSTGKPKGVAMGQQALVNLIQWQQQTAMVGPTEKTLQFAPISFDVSFQEIFSTWCSGGTLVLVSSEIRRDPVALIEFLRDNRVDRLFVPFVALQQLATVGVQSQNLPQLKEIITAGEQLQLTPDIIELMVRLPKCRLQNQYGPSESHVVSAYTVPEDIASCAKLPPIGRPIANAELYILSRELQPVPIGVSGELYIGGRALANGYLNREELTGEKFIPHPWKKEGEERLYKTGDLGRYQADGNIEFLGRIDQQVKVRGYRIETGEIEAVINLYPGVKEVVVVAREDNPGDKRLVAYFVSKEKSFDTSKLRQFLQDKFPEYMVPSAFVILDAIPLNSNGKVDRNALPKPERTLLQAEEFVAPRTPIENTLALIWQDILNIKQVSIQDNFFDLGGHSILAVRLMANIEKYFGKNLPLVTLFKAPTIEQLANILDRSVDSDTWSTVVPIQPLGSKPPLFLVPGGGGNVIYYSHLARYFSSDQPFYGLQSIGLDGESEPYTRVEDIAAHNIREIQLIQPQGPYFLGGHSFGGKVAFEMAQQLKKTGSRSSSISNYRYSCTIG
ncbi:MAG: amino acid adenylation domain-containing protein [Okeania sp. SIO2C9]|uniref:non-ribosomal peptide synthetase n=1 Tax=Okeania sp. SIO2C9 TaxID=2607791 RepID=UPI0013C1A512|nr:amino acid adenylation domain-containing protein [Okeania sp. SIO2C9]NEQ75872.1 amino acid adenylation domain-containing protein [Okeania sp. SIO2C9]